MDVSSHIIVFSMLASLSAVLYLRLLGAWRECNRYRQILETTAPKGGFLKTHKPYPVVVSPGEPKLYVVLTPYGHLAKVYPKFNKE